VVCALCALNSVGAVLRTAAAIVLLGAILAFVGTAIGVVQTRRERLSAAGPTALATTGLVMLLVGVVAVIFGAGYLLFLVVAPS
jgi:hypothetical protein